MKRIDLGQAIQIFANIGVIAGIIFLALELRQNNAQLASQTRMNIYEMRTERESDFIRNSGGIADLLAKRRLGENLTGVESARITARSLQLINTFQFMYLESPQDAIDSSMWMAQLLQITPGLTELWSVRKGDYNPDFVAFFDGIVVKQLGQ